jgi:ankyrin
MVKLLLKHGANPNKKDENVDTPLMHACIIKHFEIVQILLENGAKVNEINSNMWTSMQHAIKLGHINIVRLLLENGATPFAVPRPASFVQLPMPSPLIIAVTWATKDVHLDIIKLLFQYGVSPDGDVNNIYERPLIMASLFGKLNVVNLLLEHGVDVNCPKCMSCPVSNAVVNQNFEIAILLLEHSASSTNVREDEEYPIFLKKVCERINELILKKNVIEQNLFSEDTPVIAQLVSEFTFGLQNLQNFKNGIHIKRDANLNLTQEEILMGMPEELRNMLH